MLRQRIFGLALVASCLPQAVVAAPRDANCDLHILATPSQWQVTDIDVFASEPSPAAFELQLVNDGGEACRVHLGVDTQGAPFGLSTNNGKRVPYSISDAATGSDLTPRNGRSALNARRTVVIAPHSELLTRFNVVVAPEFATDGNYVQTLTIQASDNVTGAPLAEKTMTLSANVASSATIALSGDFTRLGGMADVDLGELRQGDIRVPLIMHVKSSRAYRVRFSSENSGKLLRAGTAWSIPYSLIVDGLPVSPTGTYSSTLGNSRRVDNMKLGFAILGNDNVAAGRYSDIITLEIAVN